MARGTSTSAAETLASYDRAVATLPGVLRKGAAMPYTARNGHMFSFLTPQGDLALRLPSGTLAKFLVEHRTRLCVQHGVTMVEYAIVPPALLGNTAKLAPYLAASHAYVGTLPPKSPPKKTAAEKTPAEKTPAKKKATKKKTAAKKKAAKTPEAKKTPAEKTPAKKKKATKKKTAAKKTPAKKTAAKKTPAKKKSPARKSTAR